MATVFGDSFYRSFISSSDVGDVEYYRPIGNGHEEIWLS